MRDDEWRMTYPGAEFTWGWPWGEAINLTAPDMGALELRVDDVDVPRGDGRWFGTDYRSGRTIAFEIGLSTRDGEAAVRDLEAQLTRAWEGDPVRLTPGAVAELRTCTVGRERATYGRPRRFSTGRTNAKQGYITAVADFATVDDRWYAPDLQAVTVSLAPPLGGGLLAPLAGPLTSSGGSDRSAAVTVGGELPAPPVVTIHGPITNPVVELVGLWAFELRTTLAYDRQVVIDCRPWARSVLLNGGGSLAGALTRTSPRLAEAGIPPGTYEVVLRGTDPTGTAWAQVGWQETYSTP